MGAHRHHGCRAKLAGASGREPVSGPAADVMRPYYEQAIEEGMGPDAIADLVADAIVSGRFWIFPHAEFVEPP